MPQPVSSYYYNIVAGVEINDVLQFNPQAVIVSNYTPYYIYFPDGLNFCPPYTTGVTLPLSHAHSARATWTLTPAGPQVTAPPPAGLGSYQAALEFTDDPTAILTAGTSISPSGSGLTFLGTIVAVNGATVAKQFSLFPAQQTIILYANNNGSNNPSDTAVINGGTTGITYYSGPVGLIPASVPVEFFPVVVTVPPTIDTSISIQLTEGSGSHTGTLWVFTDSVNVSPVSLVGVRSAPTADGQGATGIQPAAMLISNGSTWDRVREPTADAVTPVGIVATGLMTWNGSNYNRLHNPGADTLGQSGLLAAGNMLLNAGSTWNRWSDLTVLGQALGAARIGQARLATYGAVFRLATVPHYLSHAFVAPASFNYATIYHPITATKTVRIKKVSFWPTQSTASIAYVINLNYLSAGTTPVGGSPVISGTAANNADSQAGGPEATLLALPTGQGVLAGLFASAPLVLGITGANSLVNPPAIMGEIVLWPPASGNLEVADPLMRAGHDEGWAVSVDASAATTLNGYISMVFTEE